MNREDLKQYLTATFPNLTVADTFDFPLLWVPKEQLLEVVGRLKNDAETRMDFLFCETAVDRKTHFEMVYHLHSYALRHEMVVKVRLDDRDNASVPSLASLWLGAEFFENELYDLMGIHFENHPDLRRFMLGSEWPGHPLRKDYVDENMISL